MNNSTVKNKCGFLAIWAGGGNVCVLFYKADYPCLFINSAKLDLDSLKEVEEKYKYHIPHVITDDGKDGYEIEIPYEEAESDSASIAPEELEKTLHSGQIPEVYAEVIQDMKVETVRRKVVDEKPENCSVYGSLEEMQEKAKEGYFVRDPERNLVYCPAGEILRQKSIKKNGNIRYANKNACKHCPNRNKCYRGKGEWKEIDFTKDQLIKPCKGWLEAEGKKPEEIKTGEKRHYEKRKVVKFFLKPDREKMSQRMCLSEHPFWNNKTSDGSYLFPAEWDTKSGWGVCALLFGL